MMGLFVNVKMMQMYFFAGLCPAIFFSMAALGQSEQPAPYILPVQPRQMILVITKDWQAVDGRMQRFELVGQNWQPIGPQIRIVVGRNGMAWGRGLHPMPQPGPVKKEGDGKSPAGIFDLRYAFGYEALDKMPALKIPYVQCTPGLECVDDPKSSHYNQVLERSSVSTPDWHSSEKMRLTNGQYRYGIVIGHNTSPTEPGAGSCVFMHIWLGPGIGTAGCTAMQEGNIEAVLGWIDARANPVLVQLPEVEFHRLQKPWRLPDMPAQ